MPSRLNPYINFQGNAREAMEFYRGVFGGELQTTTYAEGGLPHQPADGQNVMHSQLETPSGFTLMGADTPSGAPSGSPSGAIAISLSGDDEAELSGYFQKLSDGGTLMEPLVKAPWGDQFGMLADRYGVMWFVNISSASQG